MRLASLFLFCRNIFFIAILVESYENLHFLAVAVTFLFPSLTLHATQEGGNTRALRKRGRGFLWEKDARVMGRQNANSPSSVPLASPGV